MARIENHKYSIDEAFRECFYIVPDYQREYVWGEREVLQLLEDVGEQLEVGHGKEYFVGTIIVAPTSQKSHYEVIDGQQRLTTFYLLLCALRVKFAGDALSTSIGSLIASSYTSREGEACTSLKLEPRYESAGEVIATIVKSEADPAAAKAAIREAGIPSFGSLENLVNAYATVWEYLEKNHPDTASLRKLWGYLANDVVFIQISTDVSSALKIFETINERGVGLNPMDLLKNLLFTHVSPSDFSRLRDEWKKVTKPLEKAKEKPLRFLRYFLMASYVIQDPDAKVERLRAEPVLREDEIYDWLTNPVHAAKCQYREKPFEFVRKVARGVELYVGFAQDRDNAGHTGWQMDNVRKLSGGAFTQHSILLLAASRLPRDLFLHFVSQLECFMFGHYFTKAAAKELERIFSRWADELRDIAAISDRQTQIELLDSFVDERFGGALRERQRVLEDAMHRYDQNSFQQYRTRYLLAKLAQHVDMAYEGVSTPGMLDEYTRLQIEHILPVNPGLELRAEFESGHPDADYDANKGRLGNLTLLEKPINIVAGNDFFERKQEEYAKSKSYLTRSLAGLTRVGVSTSVSRINDQLVEFDEWSPATINHRQEMLANLAWKVWRLRKFGGA